MESLKLNPFLFGRDYSFFLGRSVNLLLKFTEDHDSEDDVIVPEVCFERLLLPVNLLECK